MTGLILILLSVAIVTAVAALEIPRLATAFMAAAVGGLAFLVALFVLRAPGVAVLPIIAEAALVWMLLKAGASSDLRAASADKGNLAVRVVGLVLLVILLVLGFGAFSGMPKLGDAPYASISGSPAATYGSASFLAILFSYRALDAVGLGALIVGAMIAWLAIRAAERKA
ncbi:MAG TPA: hypothetical protein VMU02_10125 [bacterium]|nr:hypothetical protein [bacterium]